MSILEFFLVVGILALVVLILCWVIVVHRSLRKYEERTENAWKQIKDLIADRFDLIDLMKNSVADEYPDFSQRSKTALNLYARTYKKDSVDAGIKAESFFHKKLLPDFAKIVDSLPESSESESVSDFVSKTRNTNREFSHAQKHFNNVVLDYNRRIETVPANIVAKVTHMRPHQIFMDKSEAKHRSMKNGFK